MNILTILSIIILVFCIIFTIINKNKNPEKYKNEKGNVFNILFGDMFNLSKKSNDPVLNQQNKIKQSFYNRIHKTSNPIQENEEDEYYNNDETYKDNNNDEYDNDITQDR